MAQISIQICNFEPFPSIKQLNVLIESLGNSNKHVNLFCPITSLFLITVPVDKKKIPRPTFQFVELWSLIRHEWMPVDALKPTTGFSEQRSRKQDSS